MFRFLFSLLFFVVLGKWLYAEVKITAPGVLPIIDRGFEVVQIPTHDRWSIKAVQQFAADLTTFVSEARADSEK